MAGTLLRLVESEPVLLSLDTTTQAGELLRGVFPLLEPQDRLGVEEAILRLPQSESNASADVGQRERTCATACLGACRSRWSGPMRPMRLLRQMRETQSVPPNEPAHRFSFEWSEPSERETWIRNGIPYESAEAIEYRRLVAPVKDFVAKYRNEPPPSASVEQAFPAVREVADFLWNQTSTQMDGELMAMSLEDLAESIEIIRRTDHLVDNEDFVALARTILLRASESERPAPTSDALAQFDRFPSWGDRAPRVVAARGLLLMARDRRTYSTEVCEAIHRLAHDPVPAVRVTWSRISSAISVALSPN